GWISGNLFQNQRVSQSYSQNVDAKLSLEPFNDFRIELEANRRFDENKLLLFKDFHDEGVPPGTFDHRDLQTIGSFEISYFAMRTLFGRDTDDLFAEFEDNRAVISNRLGFGIHDNEEEVAYSEGYGRVQESVLVPAFLAAYSGFDANTMEIDEDFSKPLFNTLPRINWNLTYNGLTKIGNLRDIFQSVKLSHGYRSSLTVNSFNNDQAFNNDLPQAKDDNSNYYSRFQVPNMVIDEAFSPLLGLSIKTKGGMDFNVDFKKARNLSMSFSNFVLSEQQTEEYVVGFGYTMQNVYIPMFYGKGGKKKNSSRRSRKPKTDSDNEDDKSQGTAKGSDLNFQFDFALRDDVTLNHSLDQDFSEETRGARTLTISPSVDYDVSERLNVRLFFDHRSTTPKTSLGFPTSNTSAGVTVRFSLN
ncbi:MAG: cell surface protein SprA, partial [Saprospiraceae bacterium]|nr:cell surface protein SprA [Saprospiraceae bacterium]